MKRQMKLLTVFFLVSFLLFTIVYKTTANSILLPVAITLGTCSYHFVMRLIVGYGINAIYHNRMNYRKNWFQPKKWENNIVNLQKSGNIYINSNDNKQ